VLAPGGSPVVPHGVARATLADASECPDWRIYAGDPMGVDLKDSLYALESTTIDLCLWLFPWAKFRKRKAAVKMHTLLDLHGNIPTFIGITDGKVHDVNVLDEILPEARRHGRCTGPHHRGPNKNPEEP
jgi:hypothetical protein